MMLKRTVNPVVWELERSQTQENYEIKHFSTKLI